MLMRFLLVLMMFPCVLYAQADTPETEIARVLLQQVKAWNRGDIEGFMEGYLRSDSTRFASGNTVYYGWDTVLQRYKQRYANREAMGTLTFSDLDIRVLSERYALVFGRWKLQRTADQPSGLFTLLFIRVPEGWRILHDHTSG